MNNGRDTQQQPTFQELPVRDQEKILSGLKLRADRRDILRWLGAAGLSAFAGGNILSGASSALAQTPKQGGALRLVVHSTSPTETLDPARQTVTPDQVRNISMFNGLTRVGAKGEAELELAEEIEPSADGKEWIFRLRKGVEFHDGKTLTSRDVVYSLLRHKDPKTASVVKVLMDQIASVEADGDNLIRVKTNSPNADIPVILGTSHFVILQDGTIDFSNPAGTGPYFFDKAFVPGTRTIGKKFKNYYKTGRPYFDELHVFGVTDPLARTNALLSGEADVISNINPSSVERLSSNPDIQILNSETASFSQLLMMLDRKPTDNVDFRNAVKYLLDRERFLKTVQRGYGQIGNDHLVPPNHPYYNHDLPQRTLDIDKAEYLLRKAGMKGSQVELSVSEIVPGGLEIGQMFQQSAARAGLTVNLKKEPGAGYWSNVYMKKPFIASRWRARPTIGLTLAVGWTSDATWNDSALKDPKFDSLVAEARGEIDQSKRKQLYGEIQKYLYDQGGNGLFAFTNFIDGFSSKVKGIVPNPTSELGAYYLVDTAWFE